MTTVDLNNNFTEFHD